LSIPKADLHKKNQNIFPVFLKSHLERTNLDHEEIIEMTNHNANELHDASSSDDHVKPEKNPPLKKKLVVRLLCIKNIDIFKE